MTEKHGRGVIGVAMRSYKKIVVIIPTNAMPNDTKCNYERLWNINNIVTENGAR